MKVKSVVLSQTSFVCPATGQPCVVGATIRLKPRELLQMSVAAYPPLYRDEPDIPADFEDGRT